MAAVLAVTTVVALTATAPASAASASFTLEMIGGQGRVVLGRSPDTPLVIATPSRITGTVDDATGGISGGSLSTPPIVFTQQITTPVVAEVDITATFSDTSPNSGTGKVDGLGNVSFSTSLDLALHISVAGGALTGNCTSTPIALSLVSVAPLDPELGEVTLTDPGFAIPAVATTDACPAIIADAVNAQLSSPSNSISLGLVGSLPLPPPPGEPSSTTLASTVASTPLGHPATFTATVTPAAATGAVTFLSGGSSIGIAPVEEDGTATLSTASLPVGLHQITARYSGDSDHRPSTSAPVAHTVTAIPNLTASLPGQILVGAAPTEFTTTIANPASGGSHPGLRLDVRFGRVGALTTLGPTLLSLEHKVGDTWLPITLARRTSPLPADQTGTLAGSYGGSTGFALAAGETRTVTFRIAATATAPQGHMAVQFQLNSVDGAGAVTSTFMTHTASIPIVPAERRTSSVAITGGAGAQIRQGFGFQIQATVTRGGATPLPVITGSAQLLINGEPVAARSSFLQTPALSTAVTTSAQVYFNAAPWATEGLAPGTYRVAVRFLGDVGYQPSLSPEVTITIHGQAHPAYACRLGAATLVHYLAARIDVHALMPASVPAGTVISPTNLEVVVTMEDTPTGFPVGDLLATYADSTDRLTALTFSPPGSSGSFGDMVAGPTSAPPAEAPVRLTGLEVAIPIDGEPGEVVDVELRSIDFVATSSGIGVTFSCTPVGDPALLGSVTVAGTTLSSSAVGVVEEGSVVSLSASVFPSSAQGMVEFFDGATSIGFAPVSAGVATLPTTALPQGRRSVSARYLGDLVNAPSTSEPVEVSVRDVILCRNQTGTESGSVVRSTYLSLLGRCAEPSGFAFWRGRLDAGLSAEVFAGQIANTLEAHGRSVDDGYQLVLGRNADASGRAFWAQRLNSGQRYDLLLGDLAASPEFWAASGSTNSGFVTRLYDRLLHRAPDSAGLAYWVGRLDAGASRASVAASFVRLPEPSGQIVVDAYEAILDRSPTAGEKAPAVAAFQASGHRWKVYAGLIGTTEFHDRAQGHPNS